MIQIENGKKEIILKWIHLQNFKGIRDKRIEFHERLTNIFGDNRTGKTTVNDAFRWLLFNKDSTDRSQFSIKTLTENNEELHGLEHTVEAGLLINGKEKVFKKTYREVWTKKRGSAEKTFSKHENLYFVNDEPKQAGEFQGTVSQILDEVVFRLITDPLYFSMQVSWQDRRSTLLQVVGEVNQDMVISSNNKLEKLTQLLDDKTIEGLRKTIADKKKKLSDQIKAIPARIDEANRAIKNFDAKVLNAEKEELETSLGLIDTQIDLYPTNDEAKQQMSELAGKISRIELDSENKLRVETRQKNGVINSKKDELQKLNHDLENLNAVKLDIRKLQEEMTQLRADWQVENDKVFSPDVNAMELICPTCKRAFDTDKIEQKKKELQENFNHNKAETLANITTKGNQKKQKVEELEKQLEKTEELLQEIEAKRSEITTLEAEIKNMAIIYPDELEALQNELAELEKKFKEPADAKTKLAELKERRKTTVSRIDKIKEELNQDKVNEQQKARIQELQTEEKKLANQIADLEQQEFMCEEYTRAEANLLDKLINEKFKYVRFKLFNQQINGGLEPTCEALVNGVPFSDANHGGQVNAGIDIINTLCDFYNVSAPIFIDNAESVTKLIDSNSQIIRLLVSEQDKELRVEHGQEVTAKAV